MNSIIHKDTQLSIAYEQFKDKLYHNSFAFFQLIALQTLGYLFSFSSSMTIMGREDFMLNIRHINSIPLFVMSVIWIVVQAFGFSGEKRREYYMVSNNFTAYFSDIAVLEIYAVIIGITMVFSGSMLQIMGVLSLGGANLGTSYNSMTLLYYLSLFITTTIYALLFGAGAYFLGILRIRYQSFFVLASIGLILLVIAWSILGVRFIGPGFSFSFVEILRFYSQETRIILWLIKVIVTIGGLYGLSWLGIKNLEVNR